MKKLLIFTAGVGVGVVAGAALVLDDIARERTIITNNLDGSVELKRGENLHMIFDGPHYKKEQGDA